MNQSGRGQPELVITENLTQHEIEAQSSGNNVFVDEVPVMSPFPALMSESIRQI